MVHRYPGKAFSLFLVLIFLLLGCNLKYSPRTGEEFSREMNRLETLIRESADPSDRGKLHRRLAELLTHHQNPGRNYGKALREYEAYLRLTPVEDRTEEAQDWIGVLRELERAEKETVQSARIRENLVVENRGKEEALNRQEKMLDLERKKSGELLARVQTMQDLDKKKEAEWKARLEEMEKANQNLSEANRSLKESTDRMKRTLERLKNLEVQMEEKRKAIR